MRVIALIPARVGSKGVPEKNWRLLNGKSCVDRAMECAEAAGIHERIISSDHDGMNPGTVGLCASDYISIGDQWLYAPAPLHTDDCAMIDVVKDALARVPGEPDDIWVLLQPSSPLRTPEQVAFAVDILKRDDCDSVVSVSETVSPDAVLRVDNITGYLRPWRDDAAMYNLPTLRQDSRSAFKRNGIVYVFRRSTADRGDIYGYRCKPIIMERDALSIDTLDDWREAERRLKEQETETPTPAFSGRGMLNLRG